VSVGWAQLIGYSIWTLGLYILTDYRPRPRWDPKLLKELLGYGRFVLGGSLLVFFFSNLDNASVGRILGARALGFYAFAFLLGYTPAKVITEGIVASVVLPIFSKVQASREGQAQALLMTLRYVGYYAAPMCVASIVLGPPALRAVYGYKWAPAFIVVQTLAVYGFGHSYFLIMRNFCNGTGRAPVLWRISGLQLALVIPFLILAPSKYGIDGTAALFTTGKLCAAILGVAYGWRVTRLMIRNSARSLIARLVPRQRQQLAPAAAPSANEGTLSLEQMIVLEDDSTYTTGELEDTTVLWRPSLWQAHQETEQPEEVEDAMGSRWGSGWLIPRKRQLHSPAPVPGATERTPTLNHRIPREDEAYGDDDLWDSRVMWRASLWQAYEQTKQSEQSTAPPARDGT
jgi:hypothetical protein